MEYNDLITVADIEVREGAVIDMENLEPHYRCCIYKVPKDLRRVNEEANTQMENNNLITIAAIKDRKERAVIDMENLEPHSECCIYMVPKLLRRLKEAAYTPQVISIGPLHHGKPELVDMEKQKIRYMREFSERINAERWQELVTFIETNEQRIRNCYEEMPKFEKLDFITMILYDAVFIIELFLRDYNDVRNDFLFSKFRSSIFLDLQLLENQLPYFILKELYKLAFEKPNRDVNSYPSFFLLSRQVLFNGRINERLDDREVKHFVDLRRCIMIKAYPRQSSRNIIEDFPSAVKLHESGLKFRCIDDGEGLLLDIKFVKKKRCNCIPIPCLGIHELQISRIVVDDESEGLIRNVMAWEQCHYSFSTYVCDYIDLMDNLINTAEDVNLLIEKNIISNQVGDTARIKDIFNDLCLGISLGPSCYYDIVKDLKAHYKNPWNHAKATLKSVYFSNLWRGTATVAAIVLLLLTLIQTIFSIL